MTTTYYVIKVYECETCSGSGMVYNQIWDSFWNEWQSDDRPNQDDINRWFKNMGYPYPPDEDILCDRCDGSGYIREEVDIEEVINPLKNQIDAIVRGMRHLAEV